MYVGMGILRTVHYVFEGDIKNCALCIWGGVEY